MVTEEYIPTVELLSKQDVTKRMPAARCRGCGIVTWDVSIADGLIRCRKKHVKGCTKPPGRLDLLHDIPLARREHVLGGRLLRPMTNAEVAAAARELKWKG
jgi:hypothetical protein